MLCEGTCYLFNAFQNCKLTFQILDLHAGFAVQSAIDPGPTTVDKFQTCPVHNPWSFYDL